MSVREGSVSPLRTRSRSPYRTDKPKENYFTFNDKRNNKDINYILARVAGIL